MHGTTLFLEAESGFAIKSTFRSFKDSNGAVKGVDAQTGVSGSRSTTQ
jgi:hypothetical protein